MFVFGLLCTPVYATDVTENKADKYTFTGFDDVFYEIPSLPEGIKDYVHYVIIKQESNFFIYCFNDTLSVEKSQNSFILDGDSNVTGHMFKCTVDGDVWEDMGIRTRYNFLYSPAIVYSCFDLTKYADNFTSNEDFFYNPPIVETVGILAPIYQKTPLAEVVKEIVEILPVIIVTIVGLIGLRKALRFLLTVLRHS